jgi:DNA-binding NarL/FixJ family response regulator
MIRLVVVDDQTLVRSGIRQLLESVAEIDVVGEAASAEAAIRIIGETAPNVVLLDVRMPGGSGIDVLKTLEADNRLPPTILLTTFDDDEILLEGLRHGAKGFLLRTSRSTFWSTPYARSPAVAVWCGRRSPNAWRAACATEVSTSTASICPIL